MSYFRNRYKLKGIYFLDEPETALSPKSQLELLKIIKENSEAGNAQFIMATHSPILLACANATIYNFSEIPAIDPPDSSYASKKVLYLGGASSIKGFYTMVKALDYLVDDVQVIFAGTYQKSSPRNYFKRELKRRISL